MLGVAALLLSATAAMALPKQTNSTAKCACMCATADGRNATELVFAAPQGDPRQCSSMNGVTCDSGRAEATNLRQCQGQVDTASRAGMTGVRPRDMSAIRR
jgi:hypothetical protein